MSKMKKIIVFFIILFTYSNNLHAEPDGTCWSSPEVQFTLTFDSASFSSDVAGTTSTTTFGNPNLSTYYNMICAPNPAGGTLDYYKAEFGMDGNATGTTLHITDYLDAVVTLYTTSKSTGHIVPFIDYHVEGGTKPPKAGGDDIQGRYMEGGEITFTLTKAALGGAIVIPPNVTIFRAFRSIAAGVYAAQDIVVGKTLGQILPVKTMCTINNGATINVPFGDIEAFSLKSNALSSTIKKDININYACSTSITQDIDITLIATQASFDSTGIQTSISNVAVVMMYNGQPVAPYDHFRTKLVDGVGSDTITFVPIIMEGAENVQGAFTASATLVMTSA